MIEVMSAGFGAGSKWVDVTEKVKKQYQDGQRAFYPEKRDYGDPYPHVTKTLSIVWRKEGDGGHSKTETTDERTLSIILPD
jgi:hypothetical protein